MSEGGRRLGDAARLGYQIWHRRVRIATQIVHESLFTRSCVRKGFVCVSLLAVTWHGCSHGADWEVFCSVHVLFYSLYSLERMVCTFQNFRVVHFIITCTNRLLIQNVQDCMNVKCYVHNVM